MPDAPEPRPPAGRDPGPDYLKTIDEYKRAPVRFGCLGFMFSGWSLILAAAAVVVVIYLIRHHG
jgi:hypothetical protein